MRRILPFACLLVVSACGSQEEPRPLRGAARPALEVPSSKVLAGRPVEEAREGGWTVRKARNAAEQSEALAAGAVRERLSEGAAGIDKGDIEDAAVSRASEKGRAARGVAGGRPMPASAKHAPGAPPPPPSTPPPAGPVGDTEGHESAAGSGAVVPMQPVASGLKAGATDDNADFAEYLKFLGTWTDRADTAAKVDSLDVSDRRFVAVTDAAGRPFPGALVRVLDEAKDQVLWEATTYGDGRAPFYPRAALGLVAGAKPAALPAGGWLVEVTAAGRSVQKRWDGKGDAFEVRLETKRDANEPVRLDVGFLVDTTGSMGDEIERIKTTLLEVTRRLKELGREFDLRYAAVLYKDLDDDYVTMAHPFTGDVDAFAKALAVMTASGGGDTPESLNQGLAEAVGRLQWRAGAAKVLFLVADAAPHMDYEGDVRYGTSVKAAVARGIRVHAVAASGLEPFGTVVFRQIAQATRGKFIFIEYGSAAASAASHGVTGTVKSNNLDDILFEQIQDEIATWGRAPLAQVPAGVSTSIR